MGSGVNLNAQEKTSATPTATIVTPIEITKDVGIKIGKVPKYIINSIKRKLIILLKYCNSHKMSKLGLACQTGIAFDCLA